MSPAQFGSLVILLRQLSALSGLQRQRLIKDKLAKAVITLGGWTILLTLALLIWHLLSVSLPLFFQPQLSLQQTWQLPANEQLVAVGDLHLGQSLLTRDASCALVFYQLNIPSNTLQRSQRLPLPCATRVKVLQHDRQQYLLRLSAGGIVRLEQLESGGQLRELVASLRVPEALDLGADSFVWQAALAGQRLGLVLGAKNTKRQLVWLNLRQRTQFDFHTLPQQGQLWLLPGMGKIAMYDGQKQQLQFFDQQLRPGQRIQLAQPLLHLSTSPSNRTLWLNLEKTGLQKWVLVNQDGQFYFRLATQIADATATGEVLQNSRLGLAIYTEPEALTVLNSMSGEVLQRHAMPGQPLLLSDERLYVRTGTELELWQLDEQAAALTFANLWHRLNYEGYSEPAYVWQSTPGSDLAEPKYSLVPLFIGSFKAAMFALLVAMPLALGGAVYSAYFLPVRIRNGLKPGVEALEAVPSVVIGFLASIWLVSWSNHYLWVLLWFLLLLPLLLGGFALVQFRLHRRFLSGRQGGLELLLVAALVLALLVSLDAWVPQDIGGPMQGQQATLIVAIALGIAITPSIYSIAEDAIYEVPMHLRQASFALGATRLQTLSKVVLRAAAPGMLSAVMLGFGRAFGETMIVLMVTGNTPVADWDLFAGMRSLTANLAIELPESEVNSIHYRVLFLTALLLFGFTFIINTLAELLRTRVRRKYQYD